MPLSNRAPVNAAGQIMVTTTTPTAAWPSLGGMTYHPTTGELAVLDAVPAATDPWNGGIRFTNLGSMYVTTTLPSPIFYVGGLPVSTDGRLFMSSGPPVGSVGGWPISGDGGISGSGLAPVPIFFAPLTHSLVPTTAGNPAATFTRATTAYVSAVAPGGNAVDGQVLILCAANEPRFHGARRISANNWSNLYTDGTPIPAANLLGYVAENAATNQARQSQTFDDATWTKLNSSIPFANTQAAPDGTMTADTFADNATSASHSVFQPFVVGAGTYTLSVYVKQGTLPWMQLYFNDTAATYPFANFNLATGAVGNKKAGVTASATLLPNGWMRCSMTFTVADSLNFHIFSIATDSPTAIPSYVGTGQTMYLWGAQVETGDMSSYIPTTTVATVRNVDNLQYQMVSNLDGALATTYSETYLPAAVTNAQQFVISVPTFAPQFIQQISSKGAGIYSAGGLHVTANFRVVGAINKIASAWSGATASVVLNGGAVVAGAFTAYANAGSIFVGITSASASALQGSIRNVKFYATRLTDAELVALTGP